MTHVNVFLAFSNIISKYCYKLSKF